MNIRKWQIFGLRGRGRSRCVPADVPEGHLAVIVGDGEMKKRFVIPTTYVNHPLLSTLLDKAEEELGVNENGPILLPYHPLIFDRNVLFLIRTDVGLSQLEIEQVLNSSTYSSSSSEPHPAHIPNLIISQYVN
ncbi:hypothetical protein SUGI_0129510 [Cryptomeria japonica]|nr:hypothetical protein SUGI_0129510 [Cryptomeria japonica]